MTTLARTTATLAAACLVVACSGEDDGDDASSPTTPTPTPSVSASADAELVISGGDFADLTVEPGATVLVRNADSVPQNVVAEDGSFRTPDLQPGDESVFEAPRRVGSYPYNSTLQPGADGTLVVSDGSAPSVPPRRSPTSVPQPTAPGSTGAPGGY